ncbi:MAG: hypothetical protein COA79_22380 [Planctomycetota bacterium]|nr:MAG: hypothetical protein COA79_22380 [Planctomycetota bacterium]
MVIGLVKKLLNPLVVSAFILVLVLGSIAHLMYGSDQSSKYHYIIQSYYMPDYLPELMIKKRITDYERFNSSREFTGKWVSWYKNGVKFCEGEMGNGKEYGKSVIWFENGSKYVESEMNNGLINGKATIWYENGMKEFEGQCVDDLPLDVLKFWNQDGTLNKKEYYDSKGKFQKRELFEKGKLVKTETDE